jgi:hypothetical protein
VEVGWNTGPALEKGVGQRAKLSVQNSKWTNPGVDLWDRGKHLKLNCPNLLGELLTKQICSWGATQMLPCENNSSGDPAQAGSLTSPHNTN